MNKLILLCLLAFIISGCVPKNTENTVEINNSMNPSVSGPDSEVNESIVKKVDLHRPCADLYDIKCELPIEVIRKHIEDGDDLDQVNAEGMWPLLAAANRDDVEAYLELLRYGSSPHLEDSYISKLFSAAKNGDLDAIKEIALEGKDLDVRDDRGISLLSTVMLCMKPDRRILRDDIADDSDGSERNTLNRLVQDDRGKCSEQGNREKYIEIVEYLLKSGVTRTDLRGGTGKLINQAVFLKDAHLLVLLLNAGFDVDVKKHSNLIHKFAYGSAENEQDLKKMIELGADVNVKDHLGWTPAMHVTNEALCEVLVAGGAELEAENCKEQIALNELVLESRTELPKAIEECRLPEIKKYLELGEKVKRAVGLDDALATEELQNSVAEKCPPSYPCPRLKSDQELGFLAIEKLQNSAVENCPSSLPLLKRAGADVNALLDDVVCQCKDEPLKALVEAGADIKLTFNDDFMYCPIVVADKGMCQAAIDLLKNSAEICDSSCIKAIEESRAEFNKKQAGLRKKLTHKMNKAASDTGMVLVSTGTQAQVYIDGKWTGGNKTSFELEVPSGNHTLRIYVFETRKFSESKNIYIPKGKIVEIGFPAAE